MKKPFIQCFLSFVLVVSICTVDAQIITVTNKTPNSLFVKIPFKYGETIVKEIDAGSSQDFTGEAYGTGISIAHNATQKEAGKWKYLETLIFVQKEPRVSLVILYDSEIGEYLKGTDPAILQRRKARKREERKNKEITDNIAAAQQKKEKQRNKIADDISTIQNRLSGTTSQKK